MTITATKVEMVTRTSITLEDDIDGGPADQTVRFGLGAAQYEIDLNAANADRFRAHLAPFIDHARKPARGQRLRPGRSSAARRDSADVRAWAREHGIEISERGRIPTSVTAQYEAATTEHKSSVSRCPTRYVMEPNRRSCAGSPNICHAK
jgi:hypothetical protein